MVKEEERGITLITLIITVIVLLILAGITVSNLTGDNGIIKKAEEARNETEIAQGKEELQGKYMENYVNKLEKVTVDEFLEYLEEGINTKTENGKNYAEVEGKIYEIKEENGQIQIEYIERGEITAPKITNIEIIEETEDSITIKTTAVRVEGGTYYYYIGKDENSLTVAEGQNETGEYTFEGLEQGNTYYIKVEVENSKARKD